MALHDGNCPYLFKNNDSEDLLVQQGRPHSTGIRLRRRQIFRRHQHPPVMHLHRSLLQARSKIPGMLKQQPYGFAFSTAFNISELTPRNLRSLAIIKDV